MSAIVSDPGEPILDLLGIGNAIVDVVAATDDAFLADHALAKGAMTLIDEDQADRLYAQMGEAVEISGGSCANSMAGAAALGSRVAYIGRVRDDELGAIFTHDIRAAGVTYRTAPASDGPATARCLVLVTDDAERTMCTYLGASAELAPGEIDVDLVRAARITYLEGYLWDRGPAKAAFRVAVAAANEAGRKVALSLSDPFCVERHRDDFRALVSDGVDILFANEDEITSLYEIPDVDEALARVGADCEIAAITRGAAGSVVVGADGPIAVPAEPVERVVDTTGAGDLYAAGFLHALTHGADLEVCARVGAIAAAEVIGHYGARPQADLRALAAPALAG